MTTNGSIHIVERARCRFLLSSKPLLVFAPYMVIATIAFIFYVKVLPHFRAYAWVDDWIYTKPIQFTTINEWWGWLWSQHVDHRIPLQKLTNFYVLLLSGFDYRWLVAINFAMAIVTSLLLLEVAKRYRGKISIGDISIPLIILNFGMGYTQWGFHFQFMSSVLLMSAFLLLTLIWLQSQKKTYAFFSALSLALACLTGMNGVLPALAITVGFTGWAIWRHKSVGIVILFVIPLGAALTILATWTRYAGGDQSPINISEFLVYSVGLATASFTHFLQGYETAARIIIGTLLVFAITTIIVRVTSKKLDDTDLLLVGFLSTYLCLLLLISYGRVRLQGGWEYGSAIHYSTLAIFVPILAWVIISRALPGLRSEISGLAFLIVALFVFQMNYQWRTWMIEYSDPLQAKALHDLKSKKPIDQIARDNITQFHVGLSGMKEVTDGISALRKAGIELYGGQRH